MLAGNIFLGVNYYLLHKEFTQMASLVDSQKTNDKVLAFTKLFIEKVLKATTEVDFETRLKLENAVRDLNDETILAQWTKFLATKDAASAQTEVKNLLNILVNKINL